MWLDEILKQSGSLSAVSAKMSLGGTSPAAETDAEHRDIKILRPGGVLRLPRAGEAQLIIACGDGEYAALGKTEGTIPSGMLPGEIYIETENAAVFIKNDGSISLTGDLNITGSLTVNGRAVNGA